jgi:hypothetical protein
MARNRRQTKLGPSDPALWWMAEDAAYLCERCGRKAYLPRTALMAPDATWHAVCALCYRDWFTYLESRFLEEVRLVWSAWWTPGARRDRGAVLF